MLNLNRLTMLRELYRLGTLARVADSLNYTPSAVSQQLGVLEKETGVKLLEPVGRGVRLTDAALGLVARTETVLSELELAETELATGAHQTQLRLGSFQSAMLSVAPPALALLAERNPELSIEFRQREVREAYEALLSHDLDIIIGEEFPGLPEPVREGTDRVTLGRDSLHLVIPRNGSLSTMPASLAELAGIPFALDPADTTAGKWSRNICRQAGFEPRVTFETPDPLLQLHLVREGLAYALVPSLISGDHLHGTRQIGLGNQPVRELYTAVRSGKTNHPAVLACRQAFTEAIEENRAPAPQTTIPLRL